LEIGVVFDTVGRVDVDHLYLPGHPLLFKKGIHDQQGIPGNQAIGPSGAGLNRNATDGLCTKPSSMFLKIDWPCPMA